MRRSTPGSLGFLLTVLCLLLAAGCDLAFPVEQQPPPPPPPSGGGGGGGQTMGFVIIENQTSRSLTEVYISPCSDEYWGPNDLSSSLSPGASRTWEVSPSCYDLKAVNSDGYSATRFGVSVSAGGSFTWTLVPALWAEPDAGAQKHAHGVAG